MKIDLAAHLRNRKWMGAALASEIFGPGGNFRGWPDALQGNAVELSVSDAMTFDSWESYRVRHVEADSREEILKDEAPSKRYGVGLLFPDTDDETNMSGGEVVPESVAAAEAEVGIIKDAHDQSAASRKEREAAAKLHRRGEKIAALTGAEDAVAGDDDELDALRLSRLKKPRSMGITFVFDYAKGSMRVQVTGGRYRPVSVKVATKEAGGFAERKLWVRSSVEGSILVDVSALEGVSRKELKLTPSVVGLEDLSLEIHLQAREVPPRFSEYPPTARLVTVTLLNKTKVAPQGVDASTLFQSRFEVWPEHANQAALLSLPGSLKAGDEEERSMALLYRKSFSFATGHGCSGDWRATEGSQHADCVVAEPLPFYETPPITPKLNYPEGHPKAGAELRISMLPLARGDAGWLQPIEELEHLYEQWITRSEDEIAALDKRHEEAARRHIQSARACLARISKGINLLRSNKEVESAFRLTNEAIILQQLAGARPLRRLSYQRCASGGAGSWEWSETCLLPNLGDPAAVDCVWRPFQIAFLLMSLPGLWDDLDEDRLIADLIWFPTGGGKTEAYLGASAFYLIARRLKDPDDAGTGVLMRYTLRLLTSQQFQRAAGLACALESIRQRGRQAGSFDLGDTPFTIGIWVGGGTTPNTRRQSVEAYNETRRRGQEYYQHVLLRCPWCASEMGPKFTPSAEKKKKYTCKGLEPTGVGDNRSIRIHCPDHRCDFHSSLPVLVVDEEIYDAPPSIVIGTVDKFAVLSWRPRARAIFGIDQDGRHHVSPPGLIIQDELHLITGPLGSIVGLYEGTIEELCTRRSALDGKVVRPKLVASTATTRASTKQIRDLYAKGSTAIFPPPGLEAGDSFFARYDRDDKGKIKPGRMYIGVLARAYGSGLTVNVRVFAALLAAASIVDEGERDPWQTLLVFYNALRELGAGLTLFGADIPERLVDLRNRWTPGQKRRYISNILELTGRLENTEVPRALEALERSLASSKWDVVDACLASNIIEVGVDVPRLGLMAVSGQPKNTAQYIQATGRIGRSLPGLVVMVYDHRKARDLSHYEHFRSYHAHLYAQVEPASVTSYTTQVLERALHGVFTAWVRSKIPMRDDHNPRNFQDSGGSMRKSLESFYEAFTARISFLLADNEAARMHALDLFKRVMNRRSAEWLAWTAGGEFPAAVRWERRDGSGDRPMLRRYGEPFKEDWIPFTWPTPTSMRGVDAECPASVVSPPPDIASRATGLFS